MQIYFVVSNVFLMENFILMESISKRKIFPNAVSHILH